MAQWFSIYLTLAQSVIPRPWDWVPHPAPRGEPASLPRSLPLPLRNKILKRKKKKEKIWDCNSNQGKYQTRHNISACKIKFKIIFTYSQLSTLKLRVLLHWDSKAEVCVRLQCGLQNGMTTKYRKEKASCLAILPLWEKYSINSIMTFFHLGKRIRCLPPSIPKK